MLGLKGLIEKTKSLPISIGLNRNVVRQAQERTLRKLLLKAGETEFGAKYQFSKMLNADEVYEAYRTKVPVGDYTSLLPWWQRSRNGEVNITWPGKIEYFALSSGTSDGSTKYIPVSKDMIRSMQRGGLRQIMSIARTDIPKDHIWKHWLMIGGSTQLDYNGTFYSGDLSGITTGNIPFLFQRISKPEPVIKSSKNWQEKIDKITREAGKWDVGMIAGVPAWIQLLFENIIKHYNLDNIHQIWPNLEAYLHGGVSIKPYRKSLDRLMGRPIKYFESYLASEGFIAYQSRQKSVGMKMLLRNGIFYEFIPFNDRNFKDGELLPNAETLPIWQVEEGQEYALIISTNAGAWRYMIGDTIRFSDLKKNEIEITGRTKHFISLVGEHLSVDNMNRALEILSTEFNADFNEFTLAGIPHEGFFAHQWYVACDKNNIDTTLFKERLDKTLKTLNDDYRVEREHALRDIFVELIPTSVFIEWMRKRGKEGSQNKFPRVIKGEMFDQWKEFVADYKMPANSR